MNRIVLADNLDALATMPSGSVPLIYIDPPFNKGKRRHRQRTKSLGDFWFQDGFADFSGFMAPRLREAYRILSGQGSFFLHLNHREVHHCKVLLDELFGRSSFINEIIWAYESGRGPSDRWVAQHDSILWYAEDPDRYTFNLKEARRQLADETKRLRQGDRRGGRSVTDVWRQPALAPRSAERTGYPAQKPLALLDRIVRVHSSPGDLVLDCFAGSGTTGEAAARSGRRYYLVDHSPAAVRIMSRRLAFSRPEVSTLARSRGTATRGRRARGR